MDEVVSIEKSSHVLAKNNNSPGVKIMPGFMGSAKVIIQLCLHTLEASSAKLYLINEFGKLKSISSSKVQSEPFAHSLAIKALHSSLCFKVDQSETVYDKKENELGKANFPMVFATMVSKFSPKPFGLIYSERKPGDENFDLSSVKLAKNLSQTVCNLLETASYDLSEKEVRTGFNSALIAMSTYLYLYRNSSENSKLIFHMTKISNMINSTLDLNSMLEVIMDSAKGILKAEGSSLMLVDRNTNELYFNVISGSRKKALQEVRLPIGRGIAGIVAEKEAPLIVNDAQNDPRVFKEIDKKTEFVTKNLMAAPMRFRNRVIGVLEVINSLDRKEFSKPDMELLSAFSDQAAIAIQNREMVKSLQKINEDLKQKLGELSTLHEMGKALITTIDQKEFFNLVVRILYDEVGGKFIAILLNDGKSDVLELVASRGKSSMNIGKLDIHQKAVFNPQKVLLPLRQGDEEYGCLILEREPKEPAYKGDELKLLDTIAHQITKSVQNFRLLDEMLKKQAYEKELEITSSFQQSILPKKREETPYFQLGYISKPAKTMGGDFYDFFKSQHNNYVFMIADVSGKSLPAALFMAVTNSIIRTIGKLHDFSTEDILNKANNLIYDNSKSGMFVTLFYSSYNPYTHRFTYSSGGHNEQILLRQDTKEFEILQCQGRPLGILPSNEGNSFDSNSIYLQPGDILILYTDGIVEALNSKGEEFGMERLKQSIWDNHLLNAEQLAKKIYREVELFAQGEEQFDDITILTVKIIQ